MFAVAVILLEIFLPAIVFGCFPRRRLMERPVVKIVRSLLTLPFVFWVVKAHLTMMEIINYNIISGRFLHDERIYAGGAFDQGGLFKLGILVFFAFMGVVSMLGLHRMWLKALPLFVTRILRFTAVGLLVLEIGPLFLYHWHLYRYVAVMGITFYRIVGFICGGILFAEIMALARFLWRTPPVASAKTTEDAETASRPRKDDGER